jgi:hypothetical protein
VSVPVLNNSSQAIVPVASVFARVVFKAAIAEKPDGRFMTLPTRLHRAIG